MDYRKSNKEAWEEAFDNRKDNWGNDNYLKLQDDEATFLHSDIVKIIDNIDFSNKTVGQFCCNNGREILSLMKKGAQSGIGFDIAENLIEQAKETALKAEINCDFVACDILEIGSEYYEKFDFILLTVGSLTWFDDLNKLISIAEKCLKENGEILIHDIHPFMNMVPIPGEEEFDENNLSKISCKYFTTKPWIKNSGSSYMTDKYESKTFTSFSHSLSNIIGYLINCGFILKKFHEFDYDVGLTKLYDDKGYPLSFIILAEKHII